MATTYGPYDGVPGPYGPRIIGLGHAGTFSDRERRAFEAATLAATGKAWSFGAPFPPSGGATGFWSLNVDGTITAV